MIFLKTESQSWRQECLSWEVDEMLEYWRELSCTRQRMLNSQESVAKMGLHSHFSVAFPMLEESFEQRIRIKYIHTVQLNSWISLRAMGFLFWFFSPHLSHVSLLLFTSHYDFALGLTSVYSLTMLSSKRFPVSSFLSVSSTFCKAWNVSCLQSIGCSPAPGHCFCTRLIQLIPQAVIFLFLLNAGYLKKLLSY